MAIHSLTADQMREVDRLMVEEYRISLDQMMEQAGRNLADFAIGTLETKRSHPGPYNIIVVCGKGNNGGGGMTAARFLFNRNQNVSVVLVALSPEHIKPAPARRWKTLEKMSVPVISPTREVLMPHLKKADLVIDAVLGYSLKGPPRGIAAELVRMIMDSKNTNIISLDIPSGLNATDGTVEKPCIKATVTLTLAFPKTGLLQSPAKLFVGKLYVADIGVPPNLYRSLDLPPQYLFAGESIVPVDIAYIGKENSRS